MPTAPAALERHWRHNGPYVSDAEANAIHHLKRYNFRFDRGNIYPPPGFELSKEDASAVEYLVLEYDYEYHPKPEVMDRQRRQEGRF